MSELTLTLVRLSFVVLLWALVPRSAEPPPRLRPDRGDPPDVGASAAVIGGGGSLLSKSIDMSVRSVAKPACISAAMLRATASPTSLSSLPRTCSCLRA